MCVLVIVKRLMSCYACTCSCIGIGIIVVSTAFRAHTSGDGVFIQSSSAMYSDAQL